MEIAISYYFLFVRCRKFDAYLNLVINEKGEFIALKMTKGNVDDKSSCA
jgi:hypothetical protein